MRLKEKDDKEENILRSAIAAHVASSPSRSDMSAR
jgi:hypothetical protein